ncbi:MAG: 23S rRNA (uracil(1939)-C(5))-methyltransferase RlmD [Acetilactobacillus jinshanensis]
MKVKAPVQQGKTYQVKIVNLTYQGLGVGIFHDFPIFINNALPGEKVLTRVIRVKRHFSFGKVLKFYKKSPDRVQLVDKKYLQTGIAPLEHLKYSAQLKFKHDQVAELFKKAGLKVQIKPTIGMKKPYQYRNKAQIPVKLIKGRLETGFYRRHSHYLVPITDFYIQDPKIDQTILVVRNVLRKYHIVPYNERTHRGVIRNVMVRRGRSSHQIMVGLVTRTKQLPHAPEITKAIHHKLPEVKSIIHNVNLRDNNVLLGRQNRLLYGKPYIDDQLMGLTFRISLNAFYQVNPVQTEKLYSVAIKEAQLKPNQIAIDAYCGIGTISLSIAKYVKRVYGVEIVPQAIRDAKVNAKLNHIDNVKFVANRAEDQMPLWVKHGIRPDVIFVDPPRKGLAASFIKSAASVKPKRIVYISCKPATLVRDVRRFNKLGYHVVQPVQPVDQFPQTVQIESVTVLERE